MPYRPEVEFGIRAETEWLQNLLLIHIIVRTWYRVWGKNFKKQTKIATVPIIDVDQSKVGKHSLK